MTVDIQKIIKTDQEHLVHPQFHPNDHKQPFVWVGGEGARLRAADGREYIDGLACLWNVTLGHGRKELAHAAMRQMEQLAFTTSYIGHTNVPAVQLAEKLAQLCYPSINHFFFSSGGGDANDSAIKTARFFWNSQGKPDKLKIISREHGYHGVTLGAMNATGIPGFWPMFSSKLPGFVHIPSPYPYRYVSEDKSISQGRAAANELEKAILREGPETVAAFLAEPVQGAGGLMVPQDDYFPRIREICDKYDVLLMADEVITGFGRLGRWFGLTHWKVEPDIISFAKGITSGYLPLGGIGMSDRVYQVLADAPPTRRWMHAFTYSGHPTCCAVALSNLDIIERERLVERSAAGGARLLEKLRTLESLTAVGHVRGQGLIAAVEVVADKATKSLFPAEAGMTQKLTDAMLERGLYTRVALDCICIAPPLVTTDAQLDQIVDTVRDAITHVVGG